MVQKIMIARDLDEIIKDAEAHSFDADHRVDLSHSIANGLILESAPFDLITESMAHSQYTGCSFRECSFSETSLAHAEIDRSEFIDCDFISTNFYGVSIHNSLFRDHSLSLHDAEIACADFIRSCLVGADLRRVYASSARFIDCDLSGADFSGANLLRVDFSGSDLRGANFTYACLTLANFAGADLRGADFSRAIIDGARLEAAIMDDSTIIPE